MKKGPNLCLTIFSSLSLVALIFWIVAIVINTSSTTDIYNDLYGKTYNTILGLAYTTEILLLISIIGVFVCSIVCLVKSKHFTKNSLIKGSSIVGIVGSSLGLIFCIVGFTSSIFPLIATIILLIVCFGLSLGALKHINNEIKNETSDSK